MTHKKCPRCQLVKPFGEFGRNRARRDGVSAYCLLCKAVDEKGRRLRNPEAHRAMRRLADKKHRYGLSKDQYFAMLADAAGVCRICLRQRPLVVDHDHTTKVVRGVICDTCNRGIGYLQNDPAAMRRAADYLEETCVR